MNIRYCPDCQEQCEPNDTECPECGFPLRLVVTIHGNSREIGKSQLKGWNRITQVLIRNGVRIETRRGGTLSRQQAWWALPGLGLLIFLVTIVFGDRVVDFFWEAPAAAQPVLDLGRAARAGNRVGEQGEEEKPESEIDTTFLEKALGTTPEQETITEDLSLDYGEYVNKTKASMAQIERYCRQALLDVRIRDRRRKGTLLSGDGLFVMGSSVLRDAFRNEVQTVNREGGYVQETVFIVPRANEPGVDGLDSRLIQHGKALGLSLLQVPIQKSFDFSFDYDDDLAPGDTVWIGAYAGRRFFVVEAKVVDSVQNEDNILFWVLGSNEGPHQSGAPVFNAYGELAGIFLHYEGRNTVVSLLRLREKGPLLFKYIK